MLLVGLLHHWSSNDAENFAFQQSNQLNKHQEMFSHLIESNKVSSVSQRQAAFLASFFGFLKPQ